MTTPCVSPLLLSLYLNPRRVRANPEELRLLSHLVPKVLCLRSHLVPDFRDEMREQAQFFKDPAG